MDRNSPPQALESVHDLVREGDNLAFTTSLPDFKKGDPITVEEFGEVRFFEVDEVEKVTEHEMRLRLKALKEV